jgi:hypothetical protein
MAVEVRVYSDEVVVALSRLPTKIRTAVRKKIGMVMGEVKAKALAGKMGAFIQPSTIETEVTGIGSTIIGSLEATDKEGVYAISPSKARVLVFIAKSGDLVRTPHVFNHPFPKSSLVVERALAELDPEHVRDEIEDAVIEAL